MIKWVAYCVSSPQRKDFPWACTAQTECQHTVIRPFIFSDPSYALIHTFTERGHYGKNRKDWPQLEAALRYCQQEGAQLLIAAFRKVITNATFTQQIRSFIADGGHLCANDYPNLTAENFEAIVAHECAQRQQHRARILEGLKKPSSKKSGNPQAAALIYQVNLPKINNALIFSFYLEPLIAPLLEKKISQRQMIKVLNTRKIYAPQGGPWVLSQFQKVLERILINQLAFAHGPLIAAYGALGPAAIAAKLNAALIPGFRGHPWQASDVQQVQQRMKQLALLQELYHFAFAIRPIFEKYSVAQLTGDIFVSEAARLGLQLPAFLTHLVPVEAIYEPA